MAIDCSPTTTLGVFAEETGPCEDRHVVLLTGGFDKSYVYGLTKALAAEAVRADVIGSDEIDGPQMHSTPGLRFYNFLSGKSSERLSEKLTRVFHYYVRVMSYAATAKPKIFHILWNSKLELFDRTLLMLYYRALGKRIVFTAHNVNAGKRDGNDSLLNRLTLGIQYRLCDHIFVHTERMKQELKNEFKVPEASVTVIPFGINNSIPKTELTATDARGRLGIEKGDKVILFFGALRRYKGLEYLVKAFLELAVALPELRLIIAGQPRREDEGYVEEIQRQIQHDKNRDRVIWETRYILDEETEQYFKAADVLALPYTHIFQSGVLFLAYSFGLPVVATDVGLVRDEVIEGETGFLCQPRDVDDLTSALWGYFESDLFREHTLRGPKISEWANARHSWTTVAEKTCRIYRSVLED